jgi:hypothetical protein
MNLYNKEGYLSLTEYEALSRVELSEKRRLLVYICSPYSGNVNHNIKMAQKYSRFAVYKNFIPITPHIYFTQFLDDLNPTERKIAIQMNQSLMRLCSQVWVFGNKISKGMQKEIKYAQRKHIKIRYFKEEIE